MIRYAYWNWGDWKNDELLTDAIEDSYWSGYTTGNPGWSRQRKREKDELS